MRLIMQYLWNMVPYCVFGLLLYVVIRVVFMRRTINWRREIVIGLFVAYCTGLASQTIIPHFNIGISSTTGKPFIDVFLNNENASVNLIPFKTIADQFTNKNEVVATGDAAGVSLLNILANLFLFSPVGFFVPWLFGKCNRLGRIVILGIIVSSAVEIIQLFVGRSCDIDDVIFNTVGVVIGYELTKSVEKCELEGLCNRRV